MAAHRRAQELVLPELPADARRRRGAVMTRARLRFAKGDPIVFALEDVVAYGPPVTGFRAWLGAVNASAEGRWIIHLKGEEILGFRRDELKRARATTGGAELVFGEGEAERTVEIHEADVVLWSPEPDDVRSWLGRLAHGSGEAWVRLADGSELRFPIGDGPHVSLLP